METSCPHPNSETEKSFPTEGRIINDDRCLSQISSTTQSTSWLAMVGSLKGKGTSAFLEYNAVLVEGSPVQPCGIRDFNCQATKKQKKVTK